MRRLHLRGRENILKRLVVHSGAANLGLLMRKLSGRGTPRPSEILSACFRLSALHAARVCQQRWFRRFSDLMAGCQPTHTITSVA